MPREPVTQVNDENMRIEYVPLAALARWPSNPKGHDLGAISQSVERWGYISPIIIDEASGRIVAGHGRLDTLLALKQQGHAPPARIHVERGEWHVPVVRGIAFASEHEAEAYLVADNQLTMLGGWSDVDLYEVLKKQAEADTLTGIGFDADDVEDLRRRLAADEEEGDGEEGQVESPEFPVFPIEQVIDTAFQFFRSRGFPYRQLPLHVQYQHLNRLAALDIDKAKNSNLGYAVADTYHPHRFECKAVQKSSPLESFAKDDRLQHALRLMLEGGGMVLDAYFPTLSIVRGTQACSNFRPGMAMHYYRRFAPQNGLVLDPCTGYGGRLIGWIASRLGGRYVGVDPSTKTHAANLAMAHALAARESVTLINQPFEDVDLDQYDLRGQVDFAFTSPPYFLKEDYSTESTQSRVRYTTIDQWREGFLRPLFETCYAALKPGALCVINIVDVKIRDRVFPLEEMTRTCAADAGFTLEATEEMEFPQHFGQGATATEEEGRDREPTFLFRKPNSRHREPVR